MRKVIYLVTIILVLNFLPSEARRIKPFSELAYPGYMYDREEGFKELMGRIESKLPQKNGFPFCIALTGETGAGQTTIANLYGEKLREKGYKVCVVSGDNFIIPKGLRTPPGSKYPSWLIDLSKKKEEEIGLLGIKLHKLGEGVIKVSTPTAEYIVKFDKKKIPIWKLPGPTETEIEIEWQGGNKYRFNCPVFVSKFQRYYYAMVKRLIQGQDAFMPIFDQATRDWWRLADEELSRVKRNGKKRYENYVYLAGESKRTGKNLWVDVNTGILYERVSPKDKDVIIFENIWNLLDPEIVDLFDDYIFVYANQNVREYNFGTRHIFEGRYKKRMLRDIIDESAGRWWEQQRRFVERQLETVVRKGGIVINNNDPFDKITVAKTTGLELDERIDKAIEVCREDWEENMEEEQIDPLVFLDYVTHARILNTPLYHCIQEVMEAIKEGGIRKEGNRRADVESFLESLPYYKEMSIFEKALLDYVLVEAGLIPRALPILKPIWGWEKKGGEYSKVSPRIEEELKSVCTAIPYPILATVYFKEKKMQEEKSGSIIENWGFKFFVDSLLSQPGKTALEAAAEVAKVYPYVCNAVYAAEKLRYYTPFSENPSSLVIGCGDLSWVLPFARALEFKQLAGVDIRDLKSQAEEEIKRWELWEKYESGEINWYLGDATSLKDVKDLEGKKYNLILIRTPFQYLKDLYDSLVSALPYLEENGVIVLYTHKDELESGYKVPETILEAGEKLKLLQFDVYPLNPRLPLLPYKMGDKVTVLTKEEANKFIKYLEEIIPTLKKD